MAGSRHFGILVATLLAVLAADLAADSRVGVSIGGVGALRGAVGGPSGTFRAYSYGLGGLQAPSGPSTNILRSAIESRANYTIRPAGGLPAPDIGLVLPAMPSAAVGGYQPAIRPLSQAPPGGYIGPTYSGSIPAVSAMNAAADYLEAIGTPGAPQPGSEVIASLAPREKGAMGDHVAQGEKLLREGDYDTALKEFQKAYVIDDKNPETLLSLAHASFATAGSSYYRTSYYIRRALKYLPELALAPLSPKSFFGDPAQYAARLARLEERLQRFPNDADSYLTQAYFRWFDQDVEGSRQALAQARKCTKSPDLIEAITTFWEGMVASGKVSGELTPTTLPAASGPGSTTLPSAPEAKASADKETQ